MLSTRIVPRRGRAAASEAELVGKSNDASARTRSHGAPSARAIWLLLAWPLAFAALGCAALPLDLPIAQWFHDGHCPGELLRWLSFAETYAYGFGVACILLTVFVLDPGKRRLLPRVAATAFGGGLVANGLKMLLARTRPHDFFPKLSGGLASSSLHLAHGLPRTVADTFGQWLPLGRVPSGLQSFPSGHMATALGLTAALIWLYPRGKGIFPLFAILAGCQRMSSGSHFLSDVIWGAAAGSCAVILFLPGGRLAPLFDRLEAWLASAARRRSLAPAKETAAAPRRAPAEIGDRQTV